MKREESIVVLVRKVGSRVEEGEGLVEDWAGERRKVGMEDKRQSGVGVCSL